MLKYNLFYTLTLLHHCIDSILPSLSSSLHRVSFPYIFLPYVNFQHANFRCDIFLSFYFILTTFLVAFFSRFSTWFLSFPSALVSFANEILIPFSDFNEVIYQTDPADLRKGEEISLLGDYRSISLTRKTHAEKEDIPCKISTHSPKIRNSLRSIPARVFKDC